MPTVRSSRIASASVAAVTSATSFRTASTRRWSASLADTRSTVITDARSRGCSAASGARRPAWGRYAATASRLSGETGRGARNGRGRLVGEAASMFGPETHDEVSETGEPCPADAPIHLAPLDRDVPRRSPALPLAAIQNDGDARQVDERSDQMVVELKLGATHHDEQTYSGERGRGQLLDDLAGMPQTDAMRLGRIVQGFALSEHSPEAFPLAPGADNFHRRTPRSRDNAPLGSEGSSSFRSRWLAQPPTSRSRPRRRAAERSSSTRSHAGGGASSDRAERESSVLVGAWSMGRAANSGQCPVSRQSLCVPARSASFCFRRQSLIDPRTPPELTMPLLRAPPSPTIPSAPTIVTPFPPPSEARPVKTFEFRPSIGVSEEYTDNFNRVNQRPSLQLPTTGFTSNLLSMSGTYSPGFIETTGATTFASTLNGH